MLGLPPSTEINKPLPKTAVFAKFVLTAQQREHFDADISRMVLVNVISTHTVPALAEGNEVKSLYVLSVQLKRKDYDAKNLTMLARLIPQHLLFVLQYNDEIQLAVFQEQLFVSTWSKSGNIADFPLSGLNLDSVWSNVVMHVGRFEVENGNTLKEQIQQNEAQAKLQKQIERLEKKCRAEKQPRRKMELFEELKKLKALKI